MALSRSQYHPQYQQNVAPETRTNGAVMGITYLAFLVTANAMLVELLVVDFRKVPFTCSLPPFRNDTLAVIVGQFLGFALFTAGGAQHGE